MNKPNKPHKPNKPVHLHDDYKEPQPDTEAESLDIHREYVERRLRGGVPATPQAYARAMEQWQKLPGGIASLSDTDLEQAQEEPPTPTADKKDEEQKP
jgi:hypothetical protein